MYAMEEKEIKNHSPAKVLDYSFEIFQPTGRSWNFNLFSMNFAGIQYLRLRILLFLFTIFLICFCAWHPHPMPQFKFLTSKEQSNSEITHPRPFPIAMGEQRELSVGNTQLLNNAGFSIHPLENPFIFKKLQWLLLNLSNFSIGHHH